MKKHYDIVLVGTGAGIKIAHDAAKMGLSVAVLDKGPFGGTCVNRGCIPSKMLIYPSDLVQMIQSADNLNIKTKGYEAEFSSLVQRVTDEIDTLAQKIQNHYQKLDEVDVYPERCHFIEDRTLQVGDKVITGDRVVLAIGARPHIPEIEGLKDTPFMTSTEALRKKEKPKKLVIIGGGFIAAELGHFYSSMGVEVHILTRGHFLHSLDKDIHSSFCKVFNQTHKVEENSSIKRVRYHDERFTIEYINQEKQDKKIDADALLVATGRTPWTDDIGIENTSIKLNRNGFIIVNEYLKTSAKNTWALGDCIGHALFRHMANYEAYYLADQLFRDQLAPLIYPPIPFAIFTHPQIGVVGRTEEQLKKDGYQTISGVAEYKNSDMGKARQLSQGIVKLIFDRETKRLLSAHITGDDAATMIHTPIAFIQMKATLNDLIQCVFIHPALSEVVNSAAYDAKKNFEKISETILT
ncbi:MAG: dihydrolipoyl dehydrogenase [Chlamydiales bacterium]